ncbi:PxKF domain-containing protein [Streptomyces netropsis]|uniref:PxKF domain-containing protein n=1 Tax=Streptomyces netropsis TaxID=55404 RepID=UPI0030CE1EB1
MRITVHRAVSSVVCATAALAAVLTAVSPAAAFNQSAYWTIYDASGELVEDVPLTATAGDEVTVRPAVIAEGVTPDPSAVETFTLSGATATFTSATQTDGSFCQISGTTAVCHDPGGPGSTCPYPPGGLGFREGCFALGILPTEQGTVTLTASAAGDAFDPNPVTSSTTITVSSASTAPTVTGISPDSGPTTGGTSVTITGTGFTGATAVDFGTTPATSLTVNSDTSITTTAPASSSIGAVDVTVTTPNGTSVTTSADQYAYTYRFAGFFPPVKNPPMFNKAEAGRTIPLKFSLGGDQGLNILAPGSPFVHPVDCITGAPINNATGAADGSGLTFDSATSTYTYAWKTSKAVTGTCQQVNVRLADNTDHTADFSFK